MGFYTVPCYDDFGFSILTHAAWRDEGTFSAVLKAALQNTAGIRYTWEGTYATSFIAALQPGLFSENLYFVTPIVLLTVFLIALFCFLRAVLPRGFSPSRFLTLYCALSLLMINYLPDKQESFFWWNGGTAYLMMWSFMLLRVSAVIAFIRTSGKARRICLYIALLLLSAWVGGAKYSTALFALCLDAVIMLTIVPRRKKTAAALALPFMIMLAGFAWSITAPGNSVRAATMTGTIHPVKAIAEAYYFGFGMMADYVTLQLVVIWILILIVLWDALRRSSFAFPHPVLLSLVVVSLFCAQLVPTLYTGNYTGDGRVRNTYYLTFVLLMGGLVLYIAGSLLHRLKLPATLPGGVSPHLRVTAAATLLLLFFVGTIGFKPGGALSYGLQNTVAGAAYRQLDFGFAQKYKQKMDERFAILNDPDVREPVLSLEWIRIPTVCMPDDLRNSNIDYVLYLYQDYFDKDRVTLEGR